MHEITIFRYIDNCALNITLIWNNWIKEIKCGDWGISVNFEKATCISYREMKIYLTTPSLEINLIA